MPNQSHYTVGCDAHPGLARQPALAVQGAGKRYSLFTVLDARGRTQQRTRVDHQRGAIRSFLSRFPPGTPVAVETVGNWYWIVDEIACPLDCQGRLAGQAREAANVVVRQRHHSDWSGRYVVRLFERTRQRKGH